MSSRTRKHSSSDRAFIEPQQSLNRALMEPKLVQVKSNEFANPHTLFLFGTYTIGMLCCYISYTNIVVIHKCRLYLLCIIYMGGGGGMLFCLLRVRARQQGLFRFSLGLCVCVGQVYLVLYHCLSSMYKEGGMLSGSRPRVLTLNPKSRTLNPTPKPQTLNREGGMLSSGRS